LTVTADQIATARDNGLQNVETAAEVASEVGLQWYLACALLEKESGGKNVWGNDAGGTFSGLRDLITESSWRAFRHEILVRGMRSNGCGPLQLTYKPFFTQMEKAGLKPWVIRDNMLFGFRLFLGYFKAQRAEGWSMKSSIIRSGYTYNTGGPVGGNGYGERLFELTVKWRDLVGVADTQG
jgi:hypothetical protein